MSGDGAVGGFLPWSERPLREVSLASCDDIRPSKNSFSAACAVVEASQGTERPFASVGTSMWTRRFRVAFAGAAWDPGSPVAKL